MRSAFLTAGGTVFDDGAADVLIGGAGQDWFFAKKRGRNCDVWFALDSEIVEEL